MPKQLTRLALTALFALSTTTAEGALISFSETATFGGGTLVHDGTGDVSSSDGSALGSVLLMSSFGITDANLVGDLGQFTITGLITDGSHGDATSADITALWLIGTIDGDPLPSCPTCGLLNQVNVGSTLQDQNSQPIGDIRNVLFAVAIVGVLGPADWAGPNGLPTPHNVPTDLAFTLGLTSLQILFIRDRMTALGFGVDDVRLGLSAAAIGIVSPTEQQDVRQVYDLQGPANVPEPGSLLLLATGLASAGLWRKRRGLAGRRER